MRATDDARWADQGHALPGQVDQALVPGRRASDIVIKDKPGRHCGPAARALIGAFGLRQLDLPVCGPACDPIDNALSWRKVILREIAARTVVGLSNPIRGIVDAFTSQARGNGLAEAGCDAA